MLDSWLASFACAFAYTLACTLPYALFFLFTLQLSFRSPEKKCTRPRLMRDVAECRSLLKQSTLEQRAAPNQRLVRAFGINNAFTTIDPKHAKIFVKRSKDLMVTKSDEWKEIAQFSSDLMQQFVLKKIEIAPVLDLLPTIQALVFQVVVYKFFPTIPRLSDTDVTFITSEINSLWLASKGNTCSEELKGPREKLEARLRSTFNNDEESEEIDSPLNILLPAYETMWRIVLRVFLEVRFRSNLQQRKTYARRFNKFLNIPTKVVFETRIEMMSDQQVSIKDIVAEGLRLYPPTKRIYRQLDTEEVAVDIEFLHRDVDAWGEDALEFVPGRWSNLTVYDLERRMFVPFGTGTFECPARPHFGPMLLGILVGVLMRAFGDQYELIDDDNELEVDLLPLDNGREAYGGLKARGKKIV